LKLPTVLRKYDTVARERARDGTDHPRYLLRLIELELIDREWRAIERCIRAARFRAVTGFDTFEFTASPSLNKMLRDPDDRGGCHRSRAWRGFRDDACCIERIATADLHGLRRGPVTAAA